MLGIFLDSETNGLNVKKHRVLEIAFKILDVYSGEIQESFQTLLSVTDQQWDNSDEESLKINGFSKKELLHGMDPVTAGLKIQELFDKQGIRRSKAVFICQNPSFDRAFFSQLVDTDVQEKLLWPYHWLDLASMHWAISIQKAAQGNRSLPWETGYTKDKIATAYHLPSEEKPHRAMNGVNHLLLCYKAIVGFPGAPLHLKD